MQTISGIKIIFAVAGVVIGACQISLAEDKAGQTPELKVGSTLENLQVAYDGESNAQARYLAYAAKADEEGYRQTAKLFRAAAKSEEVHARNHARVIVKLKGVPKTEIRASEVKSTLENLRAGESYERAVMYPAFIKKARDEGQGQAVGSFKEAAAVEADHARLYSQVLTNPETWKSSSKDFIVCSDCGYATTDVSLTKCPICSSPRKNFFEIQ